MLRQACLNARAYHCSFVDSDCFHCKSLWIKASTKWLNATIFVVHLHDAFIQSDLHQSAFRLYICIFSMGIKASCSKIMNFLWEKYPYLKLYKHFSSHFCWLSYMQAIPADDVGQRLVKMCTEVQIFMKPGWKYMIKLIIKRIYNKIYNIIPKYLHPCLIYTVVLWRVLLDKNWNAIKMNFYFNFY